MIPGRPDVIFYRGKPCRNCAGTLRYRKTRGCAACAVQRARGVRQQLTLERRRERAEEIDIDCNA
jgi:hypothetical protein